MQFMKGPKDIPGARGRSGRVGSPFFKYSLASSKPFKSAALRALAKLALSTAK